MKNKLFRYTKEMVAYVREIAPGKFDQEITELFNKRFGLDKTIKQISSMKRNYKIKSGMHGKNITEPRKLFTDEQERFIKDNLQGNYNKKIAELVNEKFGLDITPDKIKNLKNRRGWNSGLTGQFEKGFTPWNKGMKGLNLGGEKGWFKKGHVPMNYLPVGSERIDSKDGYIVIKVKDDGSWDERWRHKHVVEWEKHNGKVPHNHVITFLDQDKTNTHIDNLVMISRRTLSYLNKGGGLSNDPQENLIRITIAELDGKVDELELTQGDKERYEYYEGLAVKNGIRIDTFKARLKKGWCIKRAAKTKVSSLDRRTN